MAKEFTLPDPGEGIHEAEIIEIKVAEGDRVEEGDALFIVETDKAEVDVPASFDGTVDEVMVTKGDDVRVGDTLLTYSESAGAESGTGDESEDQLEEEAAEKENEQPSGEADDKDSDQGDGESGDGDEDSSDDGSTGDDESEDQLEEEAAEKENEQPSGEAEDKDSDQGDGEPDDGDEDSSDDGSTGHDDARGPVPATPATRRLARELEVDLDEIESSRDDGRITDDDVRKAAGSTRESTTDRGTAHATDHEPREGERPQRPSKWPLTPRLPDLPDFERWGPVERIKLRSVRRATAQRMALAWSQVPHVTHEDIADITQLEEFRREQTSAVEEQGAKLTLTTLVVKAVVAALKEYPTFNASLDPEAGEIVLKHYYNVGVAVATDRGLVVPVIRDVDRKSVMELATELERLASRARDGDLELEEMRGGTFSVTNPGGIGGTGFTPIVNFPQVAILGCARARLEPVAVGDLHSAEVSHRFRLPLRLAFDHRVNDGADAARFVNFVCDLLADPTSFTLAV